MRLFVPTSLILLLAASRLEARPPQDEAKVVLEEHHVAIQVHENVAVLTHTLRIFNPRPQAAEAILLLPGPKQSVAFGLALRHNVASTQRESKVLPDTEARELYEEVRRRGENPDEVDIQALAMRFAASRPSATPALPRDPALLEYAGRERFSLSVYPVLPHTRQVVTVRLAAAIPSRESRFSIHLPLWVSAPELDVEKTRHPLSVTIRSKGRVRGVNLEPAVKGLRGVLGNTRYSGRASDMPIREELTLSYDVGKGSRPLDLTLRNEGTARTILDRAVQALRTSGNRNGLQEAGLKGHRVSRETSLIVIEDWVAREIRREIPRGR